MGKPIGKTKIDVGAFNVIVGILAIILLSWMWGAGILSIEGLTSNLGGILLNVVTFICIVYGIEYFQFGVGYDIRNEIYAENNIAAAIYELAIKVGLAIVIAKGIV